MTLSSTSVTGSTSAGSRPAGSSGIPSTFTPNPEPSFTYTGGKFFLDGEESDLATSDIQEISFLGAKVFSFNASVGWNGSRSECAISLIEDPDGDTQFQVPVVGSPQFFEVFDTDDNVIWSFYGIVRSVTRDVDATRRTFSVQLESPNVILDSVSLIMSGFNGEGYSLDAQMQYMTPFTNRSYNWNQVYNIINIFGFWENDQYGTYGAGYGQSEINEAGIPWKKVVIALNEIVNRTRTNGVQINDGNNVLGGSLAFSSTSYSNGKPYLYCLNFDSLVLALVEAGVPDSYRVSGAASITDLINGLAELANLQWFCTLERNDADIRDTYNNEPCVGIIKIHTISLTEMPRLDTISNFGIEQEGEGVNIAQNKTNVFPDAVGAYDKNDVTHKMEQSSLGLELVDAVTGKLVVGAKRSAMFEYGASNVYMYWGSLQPREANYDDLPLITPLLSPLSVEDVIPIDLRDLVGFETIGQFKRGKKYWNAPLVDIPPAVHKGIYYASVVELRFAAIDYDNWESYLTRFCVKKATDLGIQGETRKYVNPDDTEAIHALLKALNLQVTYDNHNLAREALIKSNKSFEEDQGIKNLQLLHERLVNAFNMYGKEFMIPMPVTAYKWVSETADFESEWDISDSAYTDITSGPNSPNFDPKFLNDSGRTIPYAIFPARMTAIDGRGRNITGALDFSGLSGDQVCMHGNSVYIKTSVDTKVYYLKQGIPTLPWSGEYTYYDGSTSFFYPEILTAANPFLGDLPYGRPTKEFFGYYTDLRGALPFAHVSLPSPVYYMKDAVGLTMSHDGVSVIVNYVYNDLLESVQGVGSDREQAPIAEGVAFPYIMSLPLQSNRHNYGPWLPRFNQNVAGKVEIEFDDTLAPENFSVGGYGYGFDAMDAVGYAKAMPDRVSGFAAESGSFSMVGVPRVKIGQQLLAGGPYLTDLNVSIDNATVKTSFKMQTWNLDFGRIKKHFVDRILRLSRTQVKVNKAKRDTLDRFQQSFRKNSVASRYRGQSSSSMIAATIQPTAYFDPWQQSLFNVSQVSTSIMPVHNIMSHLNSNYEDTAACSLDAFFAPVTMKQGYNGILPKVVTPRMQSYTDGILLNPYIQSGWVGSVNFSSGIHNIHSVTRGSELPPDLSVKHSMARADFTEDSYAMSGPNSTNIRTVANRTPQIAVGWGFDVNGQISPSGIDRYVNPSTWNAGPDLKVWDRHKQMWLGSFPIMCGVMKNNLGGGNLNSPSSGNIVRLLRTPNGVKPVEISSIFCFDSGFGTAPSGTLVYYTNWDGMNVPLYVACSGTAESIQIVRTYNG